MARDNMAPHLSKQNLRSAQSRLYDLFNGRFDVKYSLYTAAFQQGTHDKLSFLIQSGIWQRISAIFTWLRAAVVDDDLKCFEQ